jgi:single-stranded-DNA-specific exonuclease
MDAQPEHQERDWILRPCDEQLTLDLSQRFSIHPLTARILLQRGVNTPEAADAFLNPSLAQMHDPFLMEGMRAAVDNVLQALEHGERIVVHGDYDVDGISSVSVLYEFLTDIGANASYFIPRRDRDGYGLTIETVRRLQHEGAQVLITTDCGISSVDEVRLARALGMRVIIVDHHTIPPVLPPANAILNPLQPGCRFPFKQLAAVGVTFNLVVALRAELRLRGIFQYVPEPDLRNYLDLVALGTIADVVPLVDENRIFTRFGLEVLSRRKRAGISALIERACNDLEQATTQTVSFQIAPRLNAAGRMNDASICVDLLTTRSYAHAVELAGRLEEMNRERQVSEREIMRCALIQAEEQAALERPVLVLVGDDWNRGVLGIVASRMLERYNRPAILIGVEDGVGKGSARSTEAVNIIAALNGVSDLLQSYGGHVAAAGLALGAAQMDAFRTRLPQVVSELLHNAPLQRAQLKLDGIIQLAEMDEQFLQELERLEPFGYGNPEPIFQCIPQRTSRVRVVGKRHLRARFHDGETTVEGIGFSLGGAKHLLDRPFALAFAPRVSLYQGKPRLEVTIKDLKAADEALPAPNLDLQSA